MPRVALGLEYNGTTFCGWQTQPSGCAIQDALERALAEIAGSATATICAGRTDAGVHALGQVVHFDASAIRPESAWMRGVNALLPSGVAVTWTRMVADTFHARYCARERCYRYILLNRSLRPVINHGLTGWFHLPLDVTLMREAARHLVGTHDFSSFRSSECQAKSPVRELRRLDVRKNGDYIVFDLVANAFLHHMVRNIIGSLVYVGKGKIVPARMADLLAARDRRLAAPTFDAAGLYLARVSYDTEWGVPDATRSLWFDEGTLQ
jgi:tRNA pseudouridine38-40 synthase